MADDKYDHAIDYLMRYPDEIELAWGTTDIHPAGCLFQLVHGPSCTGYRRTSCSHGCLTQLRGPLGDAFTPTIFTREIMADTRIPISPEDIRLHHLPVFAEWQRRLDQELGRS